MNDIKPPKKASAVTPEVTAFLSRIVADCKAAQNDRLPRWKECIKQFRGEVNSSPIGSGDSADSISLSQIRGSQVVNMVNQTHTSQEPYVLIEDYSGNPLTARTEAVSRMFEVGRFANREREVIGNAWSTNQGIMFHEWLEKPVPHVDFKPLDPLTYFCWPTFEPDIDKCDAHFYECQYTRETIQDMVDKGVYPEDALNAGNNPIPHNITLPSSKPATEQEDDQRVTLLKWFVRWPGNPDWYQLTTSSDGGQLYYIQKYGMTMAPFSRYILDAQVSTDGAYPSTSYGSRLQGVQAIVDQVLGSTLLGIAMSTGPAVLTEGTDMEGQRIRPNEVIVVEDLGRTTIVPTTARPDQNIGVMEIAINMADQLAGVSQMGTGGTQAGVNTATEADIIAQGQHATVDAAVQLAAEGMERSAAIVDEMLRLMDGQGNEKSWFHNYYDPNNDDGQEFAQAYMQEAEEAGVFRAAVTSSQGTPRSRLNALDQFAALAMQNPQIPFQWAKYAEKRAEIMKQLGVHDAEEMVGDPVHAAIDVLLQAGAQQGADPGILQHNLAQALQLSIQQSQMGGVQGVGGGQMDQGQAMPQGQPMGNPLEQAGRAGGVVPRPGPVSGLQGNV